MKRTQAFVLAAILASYSVCTAAEQFRAAVEADWILSAELASGVNAIVKPQSDAAGGCDGIKDGKWGFHTGRDKNPWWMVDLGVTQSVSRVVLWNRCDGAAARSANLILTFSEDGKTWRTVYKHNGATFGGAPDGKPLNVRITNELTRYVSVHLLATDFLHLDEVEVFGADERRNLALGRPANQSSVSQWSVNHRTVTEADWSAATAWAAMRRTEITGAGKPVHVVSGDRDAYVAARRQLRADVLANPLLDFDDLLFVKRASGTFSHMSDQFYGWWSRPGGGLYILRNWKSEVDSQRRLVHLTPDFAPGSFLKPELSPDGKRILFSYCRFYPEVRAVQDKTRKENLPEDAFYHVFEMNVDGSRVRQLTRGRYDDFNARYLPNGEIVFLSTRRGTFLQTGHCATETQATDPLPDSYVRCGGDNWRPVAVYTLHVMDGSGGNLRGISPFENFEWDPVVANDGRIIYARWDYVDRDNMPYMSLWSTNPDGTNPQLVYGNHTRSPHSIFEARPIPGSHKFIFTASAHHSISGGSLCLLDTELGNEDAAPLKRLTPEVTFPEVEGWSATWYATPYPLSEQLFLTAWSPRPLAKEGQAANEPNALGLYVYHASGVRELVYRDPEISSSDPIPLRARAAAPVISSSVARKGEQSGSLLLVDVYQGLEGVERGTVKSLRVVGVPAKVQPHMNTPHLGLTTDDPGKVILGTVPVADDGSAHFQVPAGVNLFLQALDAQGMAVQTMRTVTYVQPGQTLSCVGCHEHRATAPVNQNTMAARQAPSRLLTGVEGTWPFRFDKLVGSVVETKCVSCHNPAADNKAAAKFDLTPARSYDTLVGYGKPSLRDHVRKRYYEGRSVVNQGAAQTSTLLDYLGRDEVHKPLLTAAERERFITWMDLYGQRLGSFSEQQERDLVELRLKLAAILQENANVNR